MRVVVRVSALLAWAILVPTVVLAQGIIASQQKRLGLVWSSPSWQRHDGIGRRLLGKGRRVRGVSPAARGQRTATNQIERCPQWTALPELLLTVTAAAKRKMNCRV